MIFGKRSKKPTLSREAALAMKPMRLLADDALRVDASGNGKLVVPIPPPRYARWLAGKFADRTKTFELDSVGVNVWRQIDGKTSVEALIRRIAQAYNLDLRQAEASTTAFLKMLLQRGLIGMPVEKPRQD